jgi:hypothetical protein
LNFANELLAFSIDDVQIIIRELSPLFFGLSFVLIPLSFYLVPVHDSPLEICPARRTRLTSERKNARNKERAPPVENTIELPKEIRTNN